ncbi:MAG: helix-turn-helix domain-containing protein [Lentisphaeria bacterium]|jgi:AraC-like DNA-binding protein/ligand-binding sensor protein
MPRRILNAPLWPTDDPETGSILERLLLLLEAGGPWRASFSDLAGLGLEMPDLEAPSRLHLHSCPFCTAVKTAAAAGLRACAANKAAVNWLVLRRQRPLAGLCGAGLTELLEPVRCEGRIVGILYYGGVVGRETEAAARRRLEQLCHRHGLPLEPLRQQFHAVPRVSAAEIEAARRRLRLAAELLAGVLRLGAATPPERLRAELTEQQAYHRRQASPLVRQAAAWLQRHFREPLEPPRLARELGCNPDYLRKLFKAQTGQGLAEFLARCRVRRACRLLASGRVTSGEAGFRVGFTSQSHFTRVFKAQTGLTPGQYRLARHAAARP